MNRRAIISFLFGLVVLTAGRAAAQCVDDTVSIPSFLNEEKNVIEWNGADWTPLFEQLDSLRQEPDSLGRIVPIVHIGDSHVQAGFLT